ncbi:hypothetical protein DIPPA_13384 [Diplonema papillatum]|nr:hypothetical protein DIPPA_13384 [Diplonema papillatum]
MHIKVRSRDGTWHGVSVASGEVKNDLNWMSNPKLGKVPSVEGGANLRLLGHGVIRQTGEKVVAAVLGQIERGLGWLKDPSSSLDQPTAVVVPKKVDAVETGSPFDGETRVTFYQIHVNPPPSTPPQPEPAVCAPPEHPASKPQNPITKTFHPQSRWPDWSAAKPGDELSRVWKRSLLRRESSVAHFKPMRLYEAKKQLVEAISAEEAALRTAELKTLVQLEPSEEPGRKRPREESPPQANKVQAKGKGGKGKGKGKKGSKGKGKGKGKKS